MAHTAGAMMSKTFLLFLLAITAISTRLCAAAIEAGIANRHNVTTRSQRR